MEIEYRKPEYFSRPVKYYKVSNSIYDYVEQTILNHNDADESVEIIASVIGTLLDTLAAKGLLDAKEIVEIVENYTPKEGEAKLIKGEQNGFNEHLEK